MTDVAIPRDAAAIERPMIIDSPLGKFVADLHAAYTVAQSLAKTSFVPAQFKGKPEEVAAAICVGAEIGLSPMASLRSIDVINGVPTLRANALRALIQRGGHHIHVVESTETRCIVDGRRAGAGSDETQRSVWTIDRAVKMGLAGKDNWKRMPQSMLMARATTEIVRMIASDLLFGLASTEEMLDEVTPAGPAPAAVSRRRREPAAVQPIPEPDLEPSAAERKGTRRRKDPAPATEVVDADIVDDVPAGVDPATGEVLTDEALSLEV